jgi:FixJ family two-component response regulator
VISICSLLESVGHDVRGYTSPRAFLRDYTDRTYGCIVMAERMPAMTGDVLHEELLRRGCKLPIIICTAFADANYAVGEMRKGAFVVPQKPVQEPTLINMVSEARWLDTTRRERRERRRAFDKRHESLTTRQRQILDFVVHGTPSRAIAENLGVSERTVELHRVRIVRIMGLRSTTELAFLVASNSPDL